MASSDLELGSSSRMNRGRSAPEPLSSIERARNFAAISISTTMFLSYTSTFFYPEVTLQILMAIERAFKDCMQKQIFVPAPEFGEGFMKPVTTIQCEPNFTIFHKDSPTTILLIQFFALILAYYSAKACGRALKQEKESWNPPTNTGAPDKPLSFSKAAPE